MGSPPPTGSMKEVSKFPSVNNILVDNDNNNKNTVTKIDHTNKGILTTPDAHNYIKNSTNKINCPQDRR